MTQSSILDHFPVAKRTRTCLPKSLSKSITTTTTTTTTTTNIQGLPTSDTDPIVDHPPSPTSMLSFPSARPVTRLAALRAKTASLPPLPPLPSSSTSRLRKRPLVVLEESDSDSSHGGPSAPSHPLIPTSPPQSPICPSSSHTGSVNTPSTPVTKKPTSKSVRSLSERLNDVRSRIVSPLPGSPSSTAGAATRVQPSPSLRLADALPHVIDLYGTKSPPSIRSTLPRLATAVHSISSRGPAKQITSPYKVIDKDIEQLTSVPLHDSLVHLLAIFKTLESMTAMSLARPDDPVVAANIQTAVQTQSRRTFDLNVLSQLVGVFPEAYLLSPTRVRNPMGVGPRMDSVIIKINLDWETEATIQVKEQKDNTDRGEETQESLLHRAVRFHQRDKPARLIAMLRRLVNIMTQSHSEWLKQQGLEWIPGSNNECYWHPDYDTNQINVDLPVGKLPLLERTKPKLPELLNVSSIRSEKSKALEQAEQNIAAMNIPSDTSKMTIAERHKLLRAKVAQRESALRSTKSSPEDMAQAATLSRLVSVANIMLKYHGMVGRPVVELNTMSDKVATSIPLGGLTINAARNAIMKLADVAPNVFAIDRIGGRICVRRKDGASLELVRRAVEERKNKT